MGGGLLRAPRGAQPGTAIHLLHNMRRSDAGSAYNDSHILSVRMDEVMGLGMALFDGATTALKKPQAREVECVWASASSLWLVAAGIDERSCSGIALEDA